MKKKLVGILGVAVIVGGIAIGINMNKEEDKAVETKTEAVATNKEAVEKEATLEESKTNEVIDNVQPLSEEKEFEERIHKMTHQKVHAELVRGVAPMSKEYIEETIAMLDGTHDYEDEEYYREVLTAWSKGDFTNALEVHNKVWEAHEGEIGEATRFRTLEEEKAYVDEHFYGYLENYKNEGKYEIMLGIGE